MNSIRRKNLSERIKTLFEEKPRVDTIRAAIALSNFIIALLLIYVLDWKDAFVLILITATYTPVFFSSELPLNKIFKQIIIFIILIPIIAFTAVLGATGFYQYIFFIILWLIFFIICNVKDNYIQNFSFMSIIIFITIRNEQFLKEGFVALNAAIPLAIHFIGVGFISAVLLVIPYLVYILIKNDPIKRKLLSKLFIKNNSSFDDIVDKLYGKDQYVNNILAIATAIQINNDTLSQLIKIADGNYLSKLKKIDEKTDKLLKQTRCILENDEYTPLNIDNLKDQLNKLNVEDFYEENLYKLCEDYIKLFTLLDEVLSGKQIKIDLPKKKKNKPKNYRGYYTLANNNFKYSLQITITTIISAIGDMFLISQGADTITISSLFAIKKEMSSCFDNVIMRVVGTALGLVAGIIICNVILLFNSPILLLLSLFILGLLFNGLQGNSGLTALFIMAVLIVMNIDKVDSYGFTRIIYVVLAGVIVIAVTACIYPIRAKYNIKKGFLKKIELTKNAMTKIIAEEPIEEDLKKIYKNENELLTNISRIGKTYKLENELDNIKKLIDDTNSVFEYMLNYYYLSKEYGFDDFKSQAKKLDLYFEVYSNSIKLNKPLKYEDKNDDNYNTDESSHKKEMILYGKYITMESIILKNFTNELIKNGTFVKLNKKI
ncbi:MAG: FUSC family protein [Methanobrevibacter sp.]|nr:FUSC family protein [Methanobrevibacter sp.]